MVDKPKAEQLKQQFAQRTRARLPFNPFGGAEITGANIERLKAGMETFGWSDYRFITAAQANANGWKISPKEKSVVITTRNPRDGSVGEMALFNASTVRGMPPLNAMLEMSDEALMKLRGEQVDIYELAQEQAAPTSGLATKPTAVINGQDDDEVTIGSAKPPELSKKPDHVASLPVEEHIDEEIVIGPARTPEKSAQPVRQGTQQNGEDLFLREPMKGQLDQATESQWNAASMGDEAPGPAAESDLAVMVPYWLDGLHNHEGLKLAEQLNRLIEGEKLARNREAITALINTYPDHRRFGLEIVPRVKYLGDPSRKINSAEPAQLLGGELVRDNEGAYRPKAGGLAVLKDDGGSLVLKNKSQQAYRGAMELALSKGWKAIELKGKPKMLAQAWLEAKMMGLEVVNYTPNEQDREQLAQRMAEEVKKRDSALPKAEAIVPEQVVVRPVLDSAGHQVMATVTYTVDHKEMPTQQAPSADNPLDAPQPGVSLEEPAVTRTVTRVGDVVRSEVVEASTNPKETVNAVASLLNREASEAVSQAELDEAGVFDLDKGAKLVAHGAAPYDHKPANKESYFVTVENEKGQSKTVWGKDLPRSLADAGAKVGDTISLIEGGRELVEVEVKEPGGTTVMKPTHRVTWKTTVLSLSSEINDVQKRGPEAVENASKGTHIGLIVEVKDGRIGQKTGRDPKQLVWHDMSKLQGGVPALGEMAEIKYSRGIGQVKDQKQEKGISR